MTALPSISQEILASTYQVEQNALGEFVFCSEDCPVMTEKVRVEPTGYVAAPYHLPDTVNHRPVTVTVYFALNRSRLNHRAQQILKQNLPALRSAPTIYLRGWADSIGGKHTSINRKLARQRALAVKAWLRQHRIKATIKIATSPACCSQKDSRAVVLRW